MLELLYINKYFDCTYTAFQEFLETRENIKLSIDEVRVILRDRYIFSPRTHKSTKRKFKKKLEKKKKDKEKKKQKKEKKKRKRREIEKRKTKKKLKKKRLVQEPSRRFPKPEKTRLES